MGINISPPILSRLGITGKYPDKWPAPCAGNHGNACDAHRAFGFILVAHFAEDLSTGANELDPAFQAQVGKVRVFGQKTVTRMHCFAAGAQGGGQQGGLV